MKNTLFLAVLLALGSSFAIAQPGPGAPCGLRDGGGPMGMMDGGGPRGMKDCSQARDPARCESHRAAWNKARESCRDKTSRGERHRCMHEQMHEYCKSMGGPAGAPMRSPECAKAADAATCERDLRARQACQNKLGRSEHMQCLQEQLAPAGR